VSTLRSGAERSAVPGTPEAGLGPIYVGGLDRSGKTTMAAFLASHPRIAIPPIGSNMETYFLDRFGDLGRPENLERCMDAMLRYSHVRALGPDEDEIRGAFGRGPATYERLFSLFLIQYADRQGKARWGAQSGLVEAYADRLFASYEGLKVIHMVRDPRDRYEASLAMWPDGRGRAGAAAARWRYSTRLAEQNRIRHPQDYLVVRFEDLVLRPEATLRSVCGFLGEVFVAEMLEMNDVPERRERLKARAADEGQDGLLSDAFVGRFRGRVDPDELAFLQVQLGRRMRRYGYTPEPVPMSPTERLWFAVIVWPAQATRMTAWQTLELARRRWPAFAPRNPDPRTLDGGGGDDG
jgi:hypothetical protein